MNNQQIYHMLTDPMVLLEPVFSATDRLEAGTRVRVKAQHHNPIWPVDYCDIEAESGVRITRIRQNKLRFAK